MNVIPFMAARSQLPLFINTVSFKAVPKRVMIIMKIKGKNVVRYFFPPFPLRYTVTTRSVSDARSWLMDPKRGHRVSAPFPSAPVAKARKKAVITAKAAAVYLLDINLIFMSVKSSATTYLCIRVAVSRVVPAKDATNTPMMTFPNAMGIPMKVSMLAEPLTKALIFAPRPLALDQLA